MKLYREPRGGGDVSLEWRDGRWEVVEMIADYHRVKRYRFLLFAFIDYITT